MPLYLLPKPPRHRMMLMLVLSVAIHLGAVGVMALVRRSPAATESASEPGESGRIELEDPPTEPDLVMEPAIEPIPEPETPTPSDLADAMPTPIPPVMKTAMLAASKSPRPVPVSRTAGVARTPGDRQAVGSMGAWSTPKPSYPFQARRMRLQGSGAVRVTTGASGRVVRAEMAPGIDPQLDAATMSFACAAWTGPPNATRVVAITYLLE